MDGRMKKYIQRPSWREIVEIWLSLPVRERGIMILKKFNKSF